MGQVFSNAELSAIVNNQPNLEREREVSATTRSIEVVNNSAYSLKIEGDTQGELITLPQMASKMIVVNPGQRITYTVLPYSISPATGVLNQQYIAVNETSIANETGIQPLALMPVYTTPVDIQNANIPISGNVDATITNPTVNVAGSVQATIENSTLEVSGNVGISGGTVNASIQGTPTFELSAGTNVGISGGTIEVTTGNVNVTNPVQTNALVKLGTTQFNVFDLANSGSLNLLVAGVATGYFQTIVLEGTSANGYTYSATANAYNRSTNIGSATLTQSNGPSGEFYASGNLSSKQSFGNVQVGLTAQTTTSATIFNDNMQAGTNWATKSGAVTYGPSGATFGANGTLITETQTPQLAPQNLTVQASAQVQNTSVTNTVNGANVGQFQTTVNVACTSSTTFGGAQNYTYASSFTINKNCSINQIGANFSTSGHNETLKLMDNSGNVLASGTITTASNNMVYANIPTTALTTGNTYWIAFTFDASLNMNAQTTTQTLTGAGVTITVSPTLNYSSGANNVVTAPSGTNSYSITIGFGIIQNNPLDTSGGARPVMLSNGWIVAGGINTSSGYTYLKVSKDNGQTWNDLCQVSVGSTASVYSMCSNGTTVYLLGMGNNRFYSFDATNVQNILLNPTISTFDTGQTSFGPGCDIKYNAGDGALHAVWCSKNSTYPNSNNVRYSKSTDGGATWQAVTQVTTWNASNSYAQSPQLVLNSNNPVIFCDMENAGTYALYAYRFNGSTWNGSSVLGGQTYQQKTPTACVAPNGTIGVSWSGCDATYTSNTQIKFSYSSDGGATWSGAGYVLTNSNGYTTPTITVDQSNKFYVIGRNGTDGKAYLSQTTNNGGTWSTGVAVTTDNINYPQAMQSTTLNFSSPLFIAMDVVTNYTIFSGTWTVGSHTMLGVEYWKDAQNYYLLQWSAGNLNLIKVVAGVQTTITSATVNETSTSVTLKLVVASNGNLTGTLSGAGTNSVTGNDTAVTLGSLGITGDNGVVVTNGFISGNYIPSDTVTVDVYAI